MKRPLLVLLAVVVAVVLVLVTLLFGLRTRERSQHAEARALPPVNVERGEVPPDPEAWELLAEAMASAEATPGIEELDALLEGEGAPTEGLQAWEPYAGSLDTVDEVLSRPGLSVPPRSLLSEEPVPAIRGGLALGRASALRGWTSEDPLLAASDMAVGVHLAHRLLDGDAPLFETALGLSLQDLALTELAELLALHPGDDELREALREELGPYTQRPRALPRALAVECNQTEALYDALEDDPAELLASLGAGDQTARSTLVARVGYDGPTTIGWNRAWCASVVRAAGDPGLPWPTRPSYSAGRALDTLGQQLFNPVGRLLFEVLTLDVSTMRDTETRVRAELEALLE